MYSYLSARSLYRSTIRTVCLFVKSLYRCPAVQFSVSTVICSVSSAACAVCYLYRWTPVRLYACTYSVIIHSFGQSSICIVIPLYCRPFVLSLSVQSSVCMVALLYSHPSVQFSACTVICSSQSAISTDGCLYSYLPVHIVLSIFCRVIHLYSLLFVQSSVYTVVELNSLPSVPSA